MTNKEFYIKMLEEETKKFRDVIEALPDDKFNYKVHDKSREAGNLAAQLAMQWYAISDVLTKGKMDIDSHNPEKTSKKDLLQMFDKGMRGLKDDLENIPDEEWEEETVTLEFPGMKWEDKKMGIAWGFLFDGIHHRGQLSTFLRAMGAKVPSIYGPSADTK
jgi:uncharacterized damage-inducible protein DinB